MSTLSIEVNGPFECNFRWKKDGKGTGLFLFNIDNNRPETCDDYSWNSVSNIKNNENIIHKLNWTVSKTRDEDFRGYLDTICITPCIRQMPIPPVLNEINFSKSEVRAGLIEHAYADEYGTG
jgi:hypothetical protein